MELDNLNIDNAWDSFLTNNEQIENINIDSETSYFENKIEDKVNEKQRIDIPKCSDLHISTKTKIAHLNQTIDLNNIFWKLPVIEFFKPECGIIKKQMKVSCRRNLTHNFGEKSERDPGTLNFNPTLPEP